MRSAEGYDRRTPVTMHHGLAANQFVEHFEAMNSGDVLNISAGKTDLQGDIKTLLPYSDINVESLDPAYSRDNWEYRHIPNRHVGLAQDLPFEDNSFSLTLCQYGLQHMPKDDVPKVVSEAVRVTKPAKSVDDPDGGTILLGPVFKVDKLIQYISENNLQDVCGIEFPDMSVEERWISARPTLIIKKLPALTSDRLEKISFGLMATHAMQPKVKSLGELVSRAVHGHSNV